MKLAQLSSAPRWEKELCFFVSQSLLTSFLQEKVRRFIIASYSDSIRLRSRKFYYGGYLNQGPKTSEFVKIFTDLIVLHSELLLLW